MKITFERVNNGWIITEEGGWSEEEPCVTVSEDTGDLEDESLTRAIREAFPCYFQSKYAGGMVLDYVPHGRETSTEEA